MICFSEYDMYDVSKFISYYLCKKEKIIPFSISDIFFAWKDSNKEFIQGANIIDSLAIFPSYTNDVILKYFKTKLNLYPFHIQDPMFTEPFSWIIEPAENHKLYISKFESGFVGIALSLSNGTFIFLSNNVNLYNIKTGDDADKIYFIERLNYNLFSHYLQFFEKIDVIKNQIIQFLFLTFDYAKKVDNNGFTNNPLVKYVLSDMHPDISNHIIIRYTANLESLIDDICNATNKSVENKYFLELLSPLLQKYPVDFHELERKIKQDFNSKKTYNIKRLSVYFYVSQQIYGEIELKTELLIAVRKRIAEICKTLDIKQGKFKNKQATKIVRLMQKTIFKEFEKELYKYEMSDLHIKALSFYSASAIEIFKNNRMYKTEQKIRLLVSRGLIYLIETNLSLRREKNTTIKCNQENFDYLLCFAHWLSELQNSADFCCHNEFDCFIEVTSDYRVNTENSTKYKKFLEKYKQRPDPNAIYPIKNDEIDKNFIEEAKKAFFQDTDIKFEEMCNIIECLMLELPAEYTKNGYEIASNIFSSKKKKIN